MTGDLDHGSTYAWIVKPLMPGSWIRGYLDRGSIDAWIMDPSVPESLIHAPATTSTASLGMPEQQTDLCSAEP